MVWRAVDDFVGREVALKELLAPKALSPIMRSRFLREARLTAQLDHPGIVGVHELARRPDGTLFCAQKLVRGETLKTRLERCKTLGERLGLLLHLIDACQAIAYAHSRGVIHRDLKPSNIMVGAFGETVVVDWGLAKERDEADPSAPDSVPPTAPGLTVAGTMLGTPAYMSPEQARGANDEVDERSDVFSLGVILHELLTGRQPFTHAGSKDVMERVESGRCPAVRDVCPEAPHDLAAVAERALSPAPADRYSGLQALVADLLAYRGGGRVGAYDYGSWELVRRFVARNRALSTVAAAALVVLVGAGVVVALELGVTRRNLAAACLDRARNAGAGADWARAAAY